MDEKEKIKKRLVADLKKQIITTERQIKQVKLNRFKTEVVRDVKVCGNILKCIYPYVTAAATIVALGVLVDGSVPFVRKTTPVYEKYTTKINSAGEAVRETNEKNYTASNDIRVYSNFEKQADGTYAREFSSYNIPDKFLKDFAVGDNAKKVVNGMANEYKGLSSADSAKRVKAKDDWESIFRGLDCPPLRGRQVQTQKPREEEMKKDYRFVTATITGEDKEKFQMERQTDSDMYTTIALELFLALGVSLGISQLRQIRGYSLGDDIRQTIMDNKPTDNTAELKSKLAVQIQNLERVGGRYERQI
jgi:hypothetical protein